MLEDKLSILTGIPKRSLVHLHEYLDCIHSQDIVTDLLQNNDVISIELFEGTLNLCIIDDNVHYKFVPSNEFNNMVVKSIINKESILIEKVSDSLKKALSTTYKDII